MVILEPVFRSLVRVDQDKNMHMEAFGVDFSNIILARKTRFLFFNEVF